MLTVAKIATVISDVANLSARLAECGSRGHPAMVEVVRPTIKDAFGDARIGYVEHGEDKGGMLALDIGGELLLAPMRVLYAAIPTDPDLTLPFFKLECLGFRVSGFDMNRERYPYLTRRTYEILDLRASNFAEGAVYLNPVTSSDEPAFLSLFQDFFMEGGFWYADGSAQTGPASGSSASGGRDSRVDVDYLSELLPSEFDEIVFFLGARSHVSQRVPQAEQLVQLLTWAIVNNEIEVLSQLVEAKRNRRSR